MRLNPTTPTAARTATPPRSADSALDEGLLHFHAPEPDHALAVHWFSLAAEAGSAEGLAHLGWCQLEGLALPREPLQARERLEQAAAAGSVTGQFQLGRMLVGGWGGTPDAARGVALYTAAAAQGHADATFNLACCLESGWGCQPDRLAAKALFLRARTLGSPLKAPGLRIRQRELDAVRDLARRLAQPGLLPEVLADRQAEVARAQDLARSPTRRAMRSHQQRARWRRLASLAALAGGLAALLAGLFGWRNQQHLAHDAGPTSTA
ncbi:tetratricopeptide repeat protein [Roseateles sp. BYS87W]|uniref:Tetratricopeptide repeat protein n=1 Tax=Pelomonas baiyunensis TaxID=3299026 RepID=A0ABW7H2N6_9BURK